MPDKHSIASDNEVSTKVEHLFRHEYGKLVSALTNTFGTSNIQLAEDVVQESMMEALQQWTYSGEPENPVGWIYKVAKYKAINVINQDQLRKKHKLLISGELNSDETGSIELNFDNAAIVDDQLRMIFTCCHLCISSDSQVALTLKTLCGFSIPEIAKAFITNEENINKRLVRARKSIREANVHFEVPSGDELRSRLDSVLEVIYLMFNEGYQASTGMAPIRYELCHEAIRLGELMISDDRLNRVSQLPALLALMYFNASRFSARINDKGVFVELEQQDRNEWDESLISRGFHYLNLSTLHDELSEYHILATISGHYCTAKHNADIDWKSVLNLHDSLIAISDTPIKRLNRAVVLSKTADAATALREIKAMPDKSVLQTYIPYHSVKAELYKQTGDLAKAMESLEMALHLSPSEPIRLSLLAKLEDLIHY